MCGCPCGFGYAVDLFGNRVQNYVRRLVARTKPKKVLVCTIYYPREKRAARGTEGRGASLMRYARSTRRGPEKHARAIRAVHAHATSRITVPGVPVVPVPLFEVLDPQDARDYEQRVEPSVVGEGRWRRRFTAAPRRRRTVDDATIRLRTTAYYCVS